LSEPAILDRNPLRNPSYPQRTHTRERARWAELLRSWEARIAQVGAQLTNVPPDDARRVLYARMLGARDQIADAARRMPTEVGDLYEEDHHRLNEAVAALERLFARWEQRS
jgi:hypothetical protein